MMVMAALAGKVRRENRNTSTQPIANASTLIQLDQS
jgi:hypothetical protein